MFIVLDLETTGLNPKEDAIIELAFVKIDRKTFKEVDRISSFINPEREIPEIISGITNIFENDVKNAPKFIDMIDEIQDFIEGFPLIGHNTTFDIRFLQSHGIDTSKNPIIDTFFLANFLFYHEKSLNLGYLCEINGIKLENAHRAIDDTLATAKLFEVLIQNLQSLSSFEKEVSLYYFSHCQDVGVRILRDEYFESKSQEDFEEILDEYIKKLGLFTGDKKDKNEKKPLKNLEEFIASNPSFELRENQKKMLDTVDNNFKIGGKILIEAPTGIGKTFAYLLPAIKHCREFGETVHISTSTKALQDQIYYKDLDFLKNNYNDDFSYTKLKGKKNYLGISSFIDFIELSLHDNSAAKISFILKIFLWSTKSEFGELDELNFYGEEFSYLPEVHAGNSFIFHESNIYKEKEFAYKARKRAQNSDIIITNNHILFQDIISEGSLLGGVKNLILDEAHSLEDIVTQSLKRSLSYAGIEKLLKKIEQRALKKNISFQNFSAKKQNILFDSAELFSLLESTIFSRFKLSDTYKTLLLSSDFFDENSSLEHMVRRIIDNFTDIQKEVASLGEKKSIHFSSETQEISFFLIFLQDVFLHTNFTKNIYYISHTDQSGTSIHVTVLNPGSFLEEFLWSSLESVVLTSATLQMQDDFGYIKNMLHLEQFSTLTLPSDFDYEKQALVFIPQDLGDIKNNLSEVLSFLEKFFLLVGGKTLVLFTAFYIIREVFAQLKVPLEQKGIHILAQSISGSKFKQIDFFKKNPDSSILLGTDTFWEGIDIPGEDLQYLLIHKIPFNVPSDPIFIARSKIFQDNFKQYAIPKAVLKLKQGFGRLIRTKNDKGIVVFLDNRIFTTSWGEVFLDAFPKDVKIRYGTSEKLLSLLSQTQ